MKFDQYNSREPLIMHVDLNSAFASIEQQSRPLLRGRPVAVLNRRTDHTAIVTASYEAKSKGVKVGMKLRDAKLLVPDIIGIESDPSKYRFVYKKLMNILGDYSPNMVMKSIDEGVIDFHGVKLDKSLEEIGYEIKRRLKEEIGCYMRCNVGIGPSRFLAKTAAGLHKPDGLDVITSENLREVYNSIKLTDLTGIAKQYEKRLKSVGIDTPLKFLDSDVETLEKIVFKGVVGKQWHQRLRGFEVDDRVSDVKTVGRQYVLESRDLNREQIRQKMHYLCESVGHRMRSQNKLARGVYVYIKTVDREYWHNQKSFQLPFSSDQTINSLAQKLFESAPTRIIEIGIRLYDLTDDLDRQISLFCDSIIRDQQLTSAIDEINRRFGDGMVHSADTLYQSGIIRTKIPFGSTRYL